MCNALRAFMASLYPADIVVQQIVLGGCCVFLPAAAGFMVVVRILFSGLQTEFSMCTQQRVYI